LAARHDGLSHDDAIARVLTSNPDLSRAYHQELGLDDDTEKDGKGKHKGAKGKKVLD
jgi:hypothetical protein